jgi:hypothetical protein
MASNWWSVFRDELRCCCAAGGGGRSGDWRVRGRGGAGGVLRAGRVGRGEGAGRAAGDGGVAAGRGQGGGEGPVPPDFFGRQRLYTTIFNQTRLANGEGDTLGTLIFDIELLKVRKPQPP